MDVKAEIAKLLSLAFAEDIGTGDATGHSVIPAESKGSFAFHAREEMVFCGAEVIEQSFGKLSSSCPDTRIQGNVSNSLDSRVKPENDMKLVIHVHDGQVLQPGQAIAEVEGNVREILAKERTVLNLIQFLSSIATETAKYVKAVEGTKAKVLDTRKTIPGLRVLSKYAVKCGGGENHRMGLYDMVMIKDNHIKEAGGITKAVKAARGYNFLSGDIAKPKPIPKIEVECDNLQQVEEALNAKPDIILLDNMTATELYKAIKIIDGKIPIEASGNVDLKTIRIIAETGVDYISTSKITIGAKPVDIGLDEL